MNNSLDIARDSKGIAAITVIIIIALLSAGLAGGGVWYWQNQQLKKQKQDSDKQIQDLQKQVDDLRKEEETSKEETSMDTDSSETSDETINWKTYTNSKYKFSIKYPDNYFIFQETNTSDKFILELVHNKYKNFEGEFPYMTVTVHPKKTSDLEVWIKNNTDEFTALSNLKKATIAGIAGYSFQAEGLFTSYNYALANGSNTYAYVFSNNDSSENGKKDFNLMINSFKFIN